MHCAREIIQYIHVSHMNSLLAPRFVYICFFPILQFPILLLCVRPQMCTWSAKVYHTLYVHFVHMCYMAYGHQKWDKILFAKNGIHQIFFYFFMFLHHSRHHNVEFHMKASFLRSVSSVIHIVVDVRTAILAERWLDVALEERRISILFVLHIHGKCEYATSASYNTNMRAMCHNEFLVGRIAIN